MHSTRRALYSRRHSYKNCSLTCDAGLPNLYSVRLSESTDRPAISHHKRWFEATASRLHGLHHWALWFIHAQTSREIAPPYAFFYRHIGVGLTSEIIPPCYKHTVGLFRSYAAQESARYDDIDVECVQWSRFIERKQHIPMI